MIPAWKIKRELLRIKDQFLNLPKTIVSLPMRLSEPKRRDVYLKNFDSIVKRHTGCIARSDRIAIFLIYQPNGVASSIISACKWLITHGYSPFIVSNCAVSQSDSDLLLEHCWQRLDRPNFGYDFGGYQDAIRILNKEAITPERLIIMNDSVWMPMAQDLMQRLEKGIKNVNIYGLLKDEKVIHDINGGVPSDRIHIESYFFMIDQDAWNHKAFQGFWSDYKMTDHKPHTIKYGEIGFSRKMIAAGLKLDALSSREVFLEKIQQKDDQFLQNTLRYSAYDAPEMLKTAVYFAALELNSLNWRAQVLGHIRKSVNRRRFHATFPYANDQIFGTTFMKKTKEPIFLEMRRAYLRGVSDGLITAPAAELHCEIMTATPEH